MVCACCENTALPLYAFFSDDARLMSLCSSTLVCLIRDEKGAEEEGERGPDESGVGASPSLPTPNANLKDAFATKGGSCGSAGVASTAAAAGTATAALAGVEEGLGESIEGFGNWLEGEEKGRVASSPSPPSFLPPLPLPPLSLSSSLSMVCRASKALCMMLSNCLISVWGVGTLPGEAKAGVLEAGVFRGVFMGRRGGRKGEAVDTVVSPCCCWC